MMAIAPTRRRSKFRSTRHWHRYLGLAAVSFALVLATTGIMLNHTEELGLDSRYIKSKPLLRWYGIRLPDPVSFYSDGVWFSQIGRQIFMDQTPIDDTVLPLIGGIQLDDYFVLAFDSQLTVVAVGGQIIEHLKAETGLPKNIQKIGIDREKNLVIHTPTGYFWTDDEMLTWHSFEHSGVVWSDSATLPPQAKDKLMSAYGGEGLPLERVILDLHSGRIFGSWGVYFFDGIAVIIILLSITGTYIFFFPSGLGHRKSVLRK